MKTWPCEHIYRLTPHWWFRDVLVTRRWRMCPICGALRPTKHNISAEAYTYTSIQANPNGKRGKRERLESEFPS